MVTLNDNHSSGNARLVQCRIVWPFQAMLMQQVNHAKPSVFQDKVVSNQILGGRSSGAEPKALFGVGPIVSTSLPPAMISSCEIQLRVMGLPLRVADWM